MNEATACHCRSVVHRNRAGDRSGPVHNEMCLHFGCDLIRSHFRQTFLIFLGGFVCFELVIPDSFGPTSSLLSAVFPSARPGLCQ